jgi:hypothetical protein
MAVRGWVISGLVTLGGLIGVPVVDSLVKEGKFPEGLGAVLSALWGWLNVEIITPLWVLPVLGMLLILLGVVVAGVFSTNEAALAAVSEAETLTADQVTVFRFIGQAIDRGDDVFLEMVARGVGLSRIATEHALEALSERKLIDCAYNMTGADFYLLTNLGRGRYLELEVSPSGSRV